VQLAVFADFLSCGKCAAIEVSFGGDDVTERWNQTALVEETSSILDASLTNILFPENFEEPTNFHSVEQPVLRGHCREDPRFHNLGKQC
jgi:hypothetical protein